MKHRDHHLQRNRLLHPRVSIGLFLIVLGLALLVATNDLLNFGSVKSYFTWETALVFVGILLLLNLHFVPGLLMIAGGAWFLLDRIYPEIPNIIKTVYWPAVITLLGLGFLISSLFKRRKIE